MRPLRNCPPRHVGEPAPIGDTLRLQIITVESQQCSVDWARGCKKQGSETTGPCPDVQDDAYFARARSRANNPEVCLKPWDQEHMIHIYGRTPDGRSAHVQVHCPLSVAVEFPETHGDFVRDIYPYFRSVEKTESLHLKRGYFNEHKLRDNFQWRARSNNWVPDPKDKTKPKKYPVVVIAFRNKSEMKKVVQHMQTTDISGRHGIPIRVSVWETTDYVKPQQRFLLENDLAPGGWINVYRPSRLAWTCTTCDYEFHCFPAQIKPDHNDQSLCPLTILSWDIEVRNGTKEDYMRMKAMGLDKFPKASDPTNSVIQISVCVRTTDGRMLRFLLELDDLGEHMGAAATGRRTFEGEEYRIFYFQAEPDMIVFFRDLLVFYDADVVLSFNGDRFDWPYVIGRMGDRPPAAAHGRFYQMGRFVTERWETNYTPYRMVKGRGGREKEQPVVSGDADETAGLPQKHFPIAQLAMERGVELTPELPGRISLDLCALIRQLSVADKYLAFKNYTLNNMAERFLRDKKVDFSHTDIFAAWAGIMSGQRFLKILSGDPDPESTSWLTDPCSNEAEVDAWLGELSGLTMDMLREEARIKQDAFVATNRQRKAEGLTPLSEPEPVTSVSPQAQRRLLGDYCMKDTLLPLRILDKLGTIMFLWQVARVAKTPPHNIINNGQMMRVSTMFIGEAWRQGRVVNRVKNRAMPYQGATVLKPKRGYYGGGTGEKLVHSKKPPLPAEVSKIKMPSIPAVKKQRPSAETLRAEIEARVAQLDQTMLRQYKVTFEDVVAAALDAVEQLPDGYDFSDMNLVDIYQTETGYAVLTLDFKSLYPSIMLSHKFCPSTLYQSDEPPTASELSAINFNEEMRKRQQTPRENISAASTHIFDAKTMAGDREALRTKLNLQINTKNMFENLLQGMDEEDDEFDFNHHAYQDTLRDIGALQRQLDHQDTLRDDTPANIDTLCQEIAELEATVAMLKERQQMGDQKLATMLRDQASMCDDEKALRSKLNAQLESKTMLEDVLQGMDEGDNHYEFKYYTYQNTLREIEALQRQLGSTTMFQEIANNVAMLREQQLVGNQELAATERDLLKLKTVRDQAVNVDANDNDNEDDNDDIDNASDDDNDESGEVELDGEEEIEGHPSGEVKGLPDEEDYTTICIVLTDKKGKFLGRRYHKYTKHDDGIYPVMLRHLLDGREIYKNKMNLEKAIQGSLELVFNGCNESTADDERMTADDINKALEALRVAIKPVMKDKKTRAEVTATWLSRHPWAFALRERVMAIVDTLVNIYDGRQKALKVMANSIYGVSGAKQHSPCACCMLAESVTAVGRQMIEASKLCALTIFAHYGCDVIYGDTDSIFVCIYEPDDKKAWAIANEIARYITEHVFAGTVNVLEDECIKRMLALFKKKTYVGMENEDVKTGIYKRGEKGIASVRRDKPEVLNSLLRQLNKAFTELGNFPRETIARVLLRLCCTHFETMVQDNFGVDEYVIVCRINKMTKESAHVNLARKLQERTGMPVMRGDSVSFVQIHNPREPKAVRRVESPVMVKADDTIKVDRAYYLSNKVRGIISSTLELFVPPEVIDELFIVYQSVLDSPGMQTLTQAFGKADHEPAEERRLRVERVLNRAITHDRLPKGNKLPEPLYARKRSIKPTPEELEKERRSNLARFKAVLSRYVPTLNETLPEAPGAEKRRKITLDEPPSPKQALPEAPGAEKRRKITLDEPPSPNQTLPEAPDAKRRKVEIAPPPKLKGRSTLGKPSASKVASKKTHKKTDKKTDKKTVVDPKQPSLYGLLKNLTG